MTAPTWSSVVAAVPHDEGCGRYESDAGPYIGPCDCTRDARIGAGCEAMEKVGRMYDLGGYAPMTLHEAMVAAFVAASRPKEEG